MYNVKTNQTFCRIIKIYYLLGIWQRGEESACRKIARKSFYMIYYCLFQIFLVSCALVSETANEAIFLAAVEILLSVVTIKLMYLLWKKDVIFAFLFDPSVMHATAADTGSFELINRGLRKFMKFVHAYLLMLGIAFVFYILSTLPMFTTGRKLPFIINFTLIGKYSEIIYWVAYAFVISEIFFGFTCTLINVIIWYVLFNYSIEYQVLGHQLRNLGKHWIAIDASRRTKFHQDLIRLIRIHRNIFQYNFTNYRKYDDD